jgi:mycoredoxin
MKKLRLAASLCGFLALGLLVGTYVVVPAKGYIAEWLNPPVISGDFTTVVQSSGKPVVLFGTSTCPFCKEARSYFEKNGIEYVDNVIDQSESAKTTYEKLGLKGVPVIFTAKHRVIGFAEQSVSNILTKDGIKQVASSSPQ